MNQKNEINLLTKSLDLGCGLRPKNPYNAHEVFGIDIREDAPNNILSADLAIEDIPFPDSYFDYITAFDFIEHIPRVIYHPKKRNSFVMLMNEIYRVLKPSGIFFSSTPGFPKAAAFRDPTHINFITDETFSLYFGDAYQREQFAWASMYGFNGAFNVLNQYWNNASLISILKKVNPLPVITQKTSIVDSESLVIEAQKYIESNATDEAVPILWNAHQIDPSYIKPLYELASIFYQNQNYQESIRICEGAAKIDPFFIGTHLIQAKSYLHLDKRDLALISSRKVLSIDPENKEALTLVEKAQSL